MKTIEKKNTVCYNVFPNCFIVYDLIATNSW
jgi:hypothetical protein